MHNACQSCSSAGAAPALIASASAFQSVQSSRHALRFAAPDAAVAHTRSPPQRRRWAVAHFSFQCHLHAEQAQSKAGGRSKGRACMRCFAAAPPHRLGAAPRSRADRQLGAAPAEALHHPPQVAKGLQGTCSSGGGSQSMVPSREQGQQPASQPHHIAGCRILPAAAAAAARSSMPASNSRVQHQAAADQPAPHLGTRCLAPPPQTPPACPLPGPGCLQGKIETSTMVLRVPAERHLRCGVPATTGRQAGKDEGWLKVGVRSRGKTAGRVPTTAGGAQGGARLMPPGACSPRTRCLLLTSSPSAAQFREAFSSSQLLVSLSTVHGTHVCRNGCKPMLALPRHKSKHL